MYACQLLTSNCFPTPNVFSVFPQISINNMAQGKLKVKSKLPSGTKTKQNKNKKGPAVHRRGNAPIQPKKAKFQETHKLKKMISKTVNTAMEDELREKALDGKQSLTKKQEASTSKKK